MTKRTLRKKIVGVLEPFLDVMPVVQWPHRTTHSFRTFQFQLYVDNDGNRITNILI